MTKSNGVRSIPDDEARRIAEADAGFARKFNKDRHEVLRNLMKHDCPGYELTDEEEAAVQVGIALDPDNPELTDEQLAEMQPDTSVRKVTLRQIDRTPLRPISPEEIRALRERAGISQGVLARHLNISTGQVAALERGGKTATGPALVLLDVIRRKGIETIL